MAVDIGWYDEAVCHIEQAWPALFDERSSSERLPQFQQRVALALEYCAGCPVAAECLGCGKANGYGGVWGGVYLAPAAARAQRQPTRRSRAEPCGTRVARLRHRRAREECETCGVEDWQWRRCSAETTRGLDGMSAQQLMTQVQRLQRERDYLAGRLRRVLHSSERPTKMRCDGCEPDGTCPGHEVIAVQGVEEALYGAFNRGVGRLAAAAEDFADTGDPTKLLAAVRAVRRADAVALK